MNLRRFFANMISGLIPNKKLRSKVRVVLRYPSTKEYIKWVRDWAKKNDGGVQKMSIAFGVGCKNLIVILNEKNVFFCVFLGMITGIGGGILRDLLSHAKPLVLVKQIYALAAIIGGLLFFYLEKMDVNYTISLVSSVLLVVLIRILAAYFRWDLPKVNVEVPDGNNQKHKNQFRQLKKK